jgi:hypothetical protein
MTLGFSTHFPEGKNNTFRKTDKICFSKIWKSLSEDNLIFTDQGMDIGSKTDEVVDSSRKKKRHNSDGWQLWKAGNKIHPVTDNRTPFTISIL